MIPNNESSSQAILTQYNRSLPDTNATSGTMMLPSMTKTKGYSPPQVPNSQSIFPSNSSSRRSSIDNEVSINSVRSSRRSRRVCIDGFNSLTENGRRNSVCKLPQINSLNGNSVSNSNNNNSNGTPVIGNSLQGSSVSEFGRISEYYSEILGKKSMSRRMKRRSFMIPSNVTSENMEIENMSIGSRSFDSSKDKVSHTSQLISDSLKNEMLISSNVNSDKKSRKIPVIFPQYKQKDYDFLKSHKLENRMHELHETSREYCDDLDSDWSRMIAIRGSLFFESLHNCLANNSTPRNTIEENSNSSN